MLKLAFEKQSVNANLSPALSMLIHDIHEFLSIFESVASRSSENVFPFHLKAVKLYHQLSKLLESANSRLEMVSELASWSGVDLRFCIETLEELQVITSKIVNNPEIHEMVHELEEINDVFQDIRDILGQEGKSGVQVRMEVHQYLESMRHVDSLQDVHAIMEKRFKMYDAELYIAYDNDFVPRTNNDLEDFNNCLKRPIRKGQGKKESWFYVEHQGEPAGYYHNLLNAPHNVGGTKIEFTSEKTPLERIGVLDEISVTSIMSLIDRELLYKNLVKNEKLYTVHRWTKRIFKHGLDACISSLDSKWSGIISAFQAEGKVLKERR